MLGANDLCRSRAKPTAGMVGLLLFVPVPPRIRTGTGRLSTNRPDLVPYHTPKTSNACNHVSSSWSCTTLFTHPTYKHASSVRTKPKAKA
jgi:hypothetical protein